MYKPLTEDSFQEFIKDHYKNLGYVPNNREFTIMTGKAGRDNINHQMHVQLSVSKLTELTRVNKVTTEEINSLSNMIHSSDRENILVADLIMEQYGK